MAAVIAIGGRGRLPVVGEIDVKLAHWLPGKSAEVYALHIPLQLRTIWERVFPFGKLA